jgi:hypothetical protein
MTKPAPRHADRQDTHGRLRCIVEAEGHVMVRRPRCFPFVMSVRDWQALPLADAAP